MIEQRIVELIMAVTFGFAGGFLVGVVYDQAQTSRQTHTFI